MTLSGKARRDPTLTIRRVLVWSWARAQAAQTNRARKLDRAHHDLDRLERGLGSRHYPDPDAATGKPTRSWHFDQAALDAKRPPTAGTPC